MARMCVVCQVLLAHQQGVLLSTAPLELGQGLSPRTTVRIQVRPYGAQSTLRSRVSQCISLGGRCDHFACRLLWTVCWCCLRRWSLVAAAGPHLQVLQPRQRGPRRVRCVGQVPAAAPLPPIVVTARQEEVPYLPLTGANQELLSLQEERVAAEMRHQETMAQLKANAAAIALTPAQAAERVDACMVRLLGHLPLCLSCVLCGCPALLLSV